MAVVDNAEKAKVVRRARRLGRYELIARIGHGGMAEVYLARQKGPMNFEKVVVVKAIHPHLAREEKFIHMLLDEARIAALIKHPRVVDIYDLGEDEGTYFIAMEHLVGQSMAKLIKAARRGDPLDVLSTAQIIADCADGLHAAHSLKDNKGKHLELVHRDVTPGNIIVTYDGGVKLLDFGVSTAKGRLTRTQGGKVKGKMGYAAPEQIVGEGIDRRSDVFSLGVVLWESLALGRLFKAANARQAMDMIKNWNPTPPSTYRDGVPKEVDEVCLKALKLRPDGRFQSALEMRNALLAALRKADYRRDAGTIEDHMQRVFGKQRREQEEFIRQVSEASAEIELGGVPDQELAGGDSLPMARREATISPAAPKRPPLPPHLRNKRESVPPLAIPERRAGDAVAAPEAKGAPEVAGAAPSPSGSSKRQISELRAELAAIQRGRWFWPSVVGAVAAILLIVAFAIGGDEAGPPAQVAAGGESAAGGGEGPGEEEAPATLAAVGNRGAGNRTAGPSSPEGEVENEASAAKEAPAAGDADRPAETGAETVTEAETVRADRRRSGRAGAAGRAGGDAEAPASEAPEPDPVDGVYEAGEEARDEKRGEEENAARANAPERDEREDESEPARAEAEETRGERASDPRRGRTRTRAQAYYREGARLMIQGKHDAAKRKFRAALSVHPGYAPAYRGLGLVYEKVGQDRAAVRALRRYLRLAPRAGDADSVRARIRRLGG